jgi:hypothetical protein
LYDCDVAVDDPPVAALVVVDVQHSRTVSKQHECTDRDKEGEKRAG